MSNRSDRNQNNPSNYESLTRIIEDNCHSCWIWWIFRSGDTAYIYVLICLIDCLIPNTNRSIRICCVSCIDASSSRLKWSIIPINLIPNSDVLKEERTSCGDRFNDLDKLEVIRRAFVSSLRDSCWSPPMRQLRDRTRELNLRRSISFSFFDVLDFYLGVDLYLYEKNSAKLILLHKGGLISQVQNRWLMIAQ